MNNIDTRTEYWENMQIRLRHDCSVDPIERTADFYVALATPVQGVFLHEDGAGKDSRF